MDRFKFLELPKDFDSQMSQTTGPSSEYIQNKAPWLKLPEETDEEYLIFSFFIELEEKDAHEDVLPRVRQQGIKGYGKRKIEAVAKKNNWDVRKACYLKFLEWKKRQEEFQYHLKMMEEYRNNSTKLTVETSEAAMMLLVKIRERISMLEADEITAKQLPQFMKSVVDVVKLSFGFQAEQLALTDLLMMFEEDMKTADQINEIETLPVAVGNSDPYDAWLEELDSKEGQKDG